jgi:hypothetical protein
MAKTMQSQPRLPEAAHRPGCPAERTEAFAARQPNGATVSVTRCLDCGGQVTGQAPEPTDEEVS